MTHSNFFWFSLALWGCFLLIDIALRYLKPPPPEMSAATYAGRLTAYAIGDALAWLLIPFIILVGAFFGIERAHITPSQQRVARILAFAVFIVAFCCLFFLNPPTF